MKRVRAGKLYVYHPVGLDLFDNRTTLEKGEVVKVINLPGCPKANTMGHCHVQTLNELGEWSFSGLVMCASLESYKGKWK